METILCIDTPVHLSLCTDTNRKITPMRFRFRDRSGELVTIDIDRILSTDQERGSFGANFICTASIYDTQRTFRLHYNYYAHEWRMDGIGS